MKVRRKIGNLYYRLLALTPKQQAAVRRNSKYRRSGLALLNQFSRERSFPTGASRVLVDGTWDNANYWIRYAIVRQALGLWQAREIGLLGEFQRQRVMEAFGSFGVAETIDIAKLTPGSKFLTEARRLLRDTKTAADILNWTLPGKMPAAILYDGILKRQRRAMVDLSDPELIHYVAEALAWIAAARDILDTHPIDLMVMSHAIDYTRGALVAEALSRNIPVLVIYGDYGTARFLQIKNLQDLRNYPGRPSAAEIENLGLDRQAKLAEAGRRYLRERLIGNTDDVGAIYAYQRRAEQIDRAGLCAHFGWDPARPIIAVYASNWFDYPHGFASFPYRDFLDWMETTITAARQRTDVNWLFKPHPCDDWYGAIRGPKLVDLMPTADRHLALCSTPWNGYDIVQAVDGVVTCHGTIAIEAGWLGKPVLTTYPGWLAEGGFTVAAADRDTYVQYLKTDWWRDWPSELASERAALFAGAYFAVPDWHEGYRFRDDSEQDAIYWDLEAFLSIHRSELHREADTTREWFATGRLFYHVHKMMKATAYLPSVRRPDYDAIRIDPRRRAISA